MSRIPAIVDHAAISGGMECHAPPIEGTRRCMQTAMRPVRVSVKAIVTKDGRLLVTRNRDVEGDFFLLPGGGQESGETLTEALRRECLEEVGADVDVHD